jgi:hypothetical protein
VCVCARVKESALLFGTTTTAGLVLETRVEIDEPTFRSEMRRAIWLLILLFFYSQSGGSVFVIN